MLLAFFSYAVDHGDIERVTDELSEFVMAGRQSVHVLELLARCPERLRAHLSGEMLADRDTPLWVSCRVARFVDDAVKVAWWAALPDQDRASAVYNASEQDVPALWDLLSVPDREELLLGGQAVFVAVEKVADLLLERFVTVDDACRPAVEDRLANVIASFAPDLVGLVPMPMIAWALVQVEQGMLPEVWGRLTEIAAARPVAAAEVGWLESAGRAARGSVEKCEAELFAAVVSHGGEVADRVLGAVADPERPGPSRWSELITGDDPLAERLRRVPGFLRGAATVAAADLLGADLVLTTTLDDVTLVSPRHLRALSDVVGRHTGLSTAAARRLLREPGRTDLLAVLRDIADVEVLAEGLGGLAAADASRLVDRMPALRDRFFSSLCSSDVDVPTFLAERRVGGHC